MSVKILVTGSKGRMGQCILSCAKQDPEIEVVGAIDKEEKADNHLKAGVVVVDFSNHEATPVFAVAASKEGCPMVIGTTGFTSTERDVIKKASRTVPVVLAPNMSVGVSLLFDLTQIAGSVLKKGFDVEIIEKHHRRKLDSPSGTASRLAEVVAEVKGIQISRSVKHGRHGDCEAERPPDEIGIHSLRGGDYVGEHTVVFAGEGEILELTHKAGSRDIFARGALRAAKWVLSARPGLYDMRDVLGLQVSRQTA